MSLSLRKFVLRQTHRQLTAVGFLFPLLARGKSKPSHMNTNAITSDETEPDFPPEERHIVSVLSGIYLEVGLPLYAAVKAAIADYECSFSDAPLCVS